MLIYTITGDNIAVSDTVRAYIEKRFKALERFMKESEREIFVTLARTTAFVRDDAVRVEVRTKVRGQDYFVAAEAVEPSAAIDEAKQELLREVTKTKARRQTLLHRGARKLKNMMKGLRK